MRVAIAIVVLATFVLFIIGLVMIVIMANRRSNNQKDKELQTTQLWSITQAEREEFRKTEEEKLKAFYKSYNENRNKFAEASKLNEDNDRTF